MPSDIELATDAARAAGRAVLPYFHRPTEVRYKTPDQPVTEADLVANRILWQTLYSSRPTYGWLSEESADSTDRLTAEHVWIVDPIDGTRSFLNGYTEFAVCIGLVKEGKPLLGVVYNPATDEMYQAVRGAGAMLNGRPIRASSASEVGSILASRSEIRRGEFDSFRRRWKIHPLGSTAYKMVRVADGRGDAFLSRGWKSEWDVCAAALVVEEAGGRVTDVLGAPLRFNRDPPLVNGIVVAGSELHARLIDHLAQSPSIPNSLIRKKE